MENPAIKFNQSDLPADGKKRASNFIKKNPVLLNVLLAFVAVTAVYIWKDVQKNSQIALVEKKALEKLDQNNREMLTALSKPLIWSIRAEMLKGNLEQVNIYVKDIVKEKNFQVLQIIDPDGKVILSTNKKVEGKNANILYDSTMLSADAIKIYHTDNNLLIMSAPIMGYDKKLGVLVIEYKPDSFIKDSSL